jgi:hypothetical protein
MNKLIFPLIVIVIILCALGCNKSSNMNTKVETATTLSDMEVIAHMRSNNVVPWNGYAIADLNYELPSEAWVTEKFPTILWDFVHDLKQTKYIEEANDCDDFSKMAAAFAHLLHSNTPNRAKRTGLAFGEFYYNINGDSKQGHAINFALARAKSGNIVLLFFDPQTSKIVKLNKLELESCQNWLL